MIVTVLYCIVLDRILLCASYCATVPCYQTSLYIWNHELSAAYQQRSAADPRTVKLPKMDGPCPPPLYFFVPSKARSPFLHAIILILGVVTMSLDSILNEAFRAMNVHTSSHSRYVCRWPFNVVLALTDFTIVSARDLSNCCNTFIANCGVIAPLVISSSRESVRAIPIEDPR